MREVSGRLKQIDVGPYGVWGVNSRDDIYQRRGARWTRVSGKLKDISVGRNSAWGVNSRNDIFRRIGGGNWQHIRGKLKQVFSYFY